jgi:hypothetical protein
MSTDVAVPDSPVVTRQLVRAETPVLQPARRFIQGGTLKLRARSILRTGVLVAMSVATLGVMTTPAAAAGLGTAPIVSTWTIDGQPISSTDLSVLLGGGATTLDDRRCNPIQAQFCPGGPVNPVPPPPPPPPPGSGWGPVPQAIVVVSECRELHLAYQIFQDFAITADRIVLRWQFSFEWCFNNTLPVGERITFYRQAAAVPQPLTTEVRVQRFANPVVITPNDGRLPYRSFLGIDTRAALYAGALFVVDSVTFNPTTRQIEPISFSFAPAIDIVVASDGTSFNGNSILPQVRI